MTCRLLTFVRSLPWIHKYIYIYIHIYIYISGAKVSKRHVKGMSKARPSKLQTTMSKRHGKGMSKACHGKL